MGSTSNIQQQRVDELPHPSVWVLVSLHTFKRYRNRFTKQQYEQITFMPTGQLSYLEELKYYQFRKAQKFNLVSTQYVQRIIGNNMCSGNEFYKVWVQHIPHRLSELKNLSLNQILLIFRQSIIGFQKIIEQYGQINITSQLIGINKQGEVKVWLNQNFQQNQPSQAQIMKMQRAKVNKINLQHQMIVDLISIIQRSYEGIVYPPKLKLKLQKIRKQNSGFKQLKQLIDNFIIEQNIQLKSNIYEQSTVQMKNNIYSTPNNVSNSSNQLQPFNSKYILNTNINNNGFNCNLFNNQMLNSTLRLLSNEKQIVFKKLQKKEINNFYFNSINNKMSNNSIDHSKLNIKLNPYINNTINNPLNLSNEIVLKKQLSNSRLSMFSSTKSLRKNNINQYQRNSISNNKYQKIKSLSKYQNNKINTNSNKNIILNSSFDNKNTKNQCVQKTKTQSIRPSDQISYKGLAQPLLVKNQLKSILSQINNKNSSLIKKQSIQERQNQVNKHIISHKNINTSEIKSTIASSDLVSTHNKLNFSNKQLLLHPGTIIKNQFQTIKDSNSFASNVINNKVLLSNSLA